MSRYRITARGEDGHETTVKSETSFDAAIEAGNAAALDLKTETEVVKDGDVIAVFSPVRGRQFHPWERVESPTFTAPHMEGFRPAYTRKRVQAVVYRSLEDASWLVLDCRTGGSVQVPSTYAARMITNKMAKTGYAIPAS